MTARLPGLDGLRGIAVGLVLVFHFTEWTGSAGAALGPVLRLASIGWCGVDLFFVLSGFLITGILSDAKGSPFFFRNFYARRVLRIFPLYYLTLFVVLQLCPRLWPHDASLRQMRGAQVWLWTYLTNVYGCWHGLEPFGTLAHFWSLAVEEHFYLVWPLLVFLLSRRHMMLVCFVLIIVAPGLRFFSSWADAPAVAVFALTSSRMDSLALGGLLALAIRGERGVQPLVRPARAVAVALVPVLAAVLFHWLPLSRPLYDCAVFTLLAFFFAAVVVVVLAKGPLEALVSRRWLRFFGQYSYGIYVFHSPLRPVFDKLFSIESLSGVLHSQALAAIAYVLLAGALTTALAVASWHLFEVYFIRLKSRFETA